MKATIKINMDNAAFEDGNGLEIARILQTLAAKCESKVELFPSDQWSAIDANGNTVGNLKVSK